MTLEAVGMLNASRTAAGLAWMLVLTGLPMASDIAGSTEDR